MKKELLFKSIVAQYCKISPEDIKDDLRFREDLGLSSLDFMSMLGELEDEFDLSLDEDKVINIRTIHEALNLISNPEVAG
jgi:acyl carrier protein